MPVKKGMRLFPGRSSQPSDYIICASHRSGSTLLCEGLRWTWLCGDPREYLSPTRSLAIHQKGETEADPQADFAAYAREIHRTKRTENGVFGLKIMWKHLQTYPARTGRSVDTGDHRGLGRALREDFGRTRFIWSRREDKVRQAVSFLKAKQTGLFTHQQLSSLSPDEAALHFDFEAVDALVRRLQREDNHWQRFFTKNRLKPHTVTYEEFAERFEATITECLEHLGIDPAQARIQPPQRNQKLADPLTDAWLDLYHRHKG
jgi:LPS sulfotransferase NodH